MFPLKLKWAIYKSYVKPEILHEGEAWCLIESKMGILRRPERFMLRTMCEVQLKDIERSNDLMPMLGFDETTN